MSVCCTMSKNGTRYYNRQDCPFNTVSFGEYVDELLGLFEEDGIIGAVIVMDNVRFHHNNEILERIRSRGHLVKFLPPYSPFLNPIENMFSQWKQLVRSGSPQNEDELLALIESSFLEISDEHCSNYYRNMLRVLNRCLDKEVIIDN
jgi:transposase